MPIYTYKHDCGLEQEFFLREDKDSKLVPCFRCGRQVTARQIRDSNIKTEEADGTIGVLEGNKNNGPRPNRS